LAPDPGFGASGLMPKGGSRDRFREIAQSFVVSPRFDVPGLVRLAYKLRPAPLQLFQFFFRILLSKISALWP
jgi:hypothetical protein